MAEPIVVAPGVVVPASALSLHTSRSSGPGGQNVNKVASKVELRVDLDRVEGLPAEARTRLGSLADGRLDAEGRLLVVSQRTRDQHRNLEDAREKVRALVRRAMRETAIEKRAATNRRNAGASRIGFVTSSLMRRASASGARTSRP